VNEHWAPGKTRRKEGTQKPGMGGGGKNLARDHLEDSGNRELEVFAKKKWGWPTCQTNFSRRGHVRGHSPKRPRKKNTIRN